MEGAKQEVEEQYESLKPFELSLYDIGDEVESAGYRGVYFERGGSAPDEILVFDPNDVTIVRVLDRDTRQEVPRD